MSNKPGILISLEGGEGCGKSTQIVRLREKLTAAGKDVIVLREPGGTSVGEQIREVVLSAKNTGISFTAEVFLFQAARAQIYREIVLPSLKAGKIVLMDRTRDSSVVYQGIVRKFGEELIEQLNDMSTQKTFPDLTFLLDLEAKIGLSRRAADGKMDRIDMEATDFHQKVRDAYLDLAHRDTTNRWKVIDATKTVEEIADQLWAQVQKILG